MESKKIEAKELSTYNPKSLVELRAKLRLELKKLQMKNAMRALKETHLIRLLRKNIARVNTFLTLKAKN